MPKISAALRSRRGYRARGFTVVEAVVSVSLTSLFLLIASQLLRDTQLASLATRRQALDPTPQHLTQNLRNDVHRARHVEMSQGLSSATWTYGALNLTFPEGDGVRYEKTNGEIRRALIAQDGTSSGHRLLMRDVISLRWMRLAPDLIELEIVFRRRPTGEALRRSWHDAGPATETTRMRLALRAVPGKRAW